MFNRPIKHVGDALRLCIECGENSADIHGVLYFGAWPFIDFTFCILIPEVQQSGHSVLAEIVVGKM
jgi:hypothetical protein